MLAVVSALSAVRFSSSPPLKHTLTIARFLFFLKLYSNNANTLATAMGTSSAEEASDVDNELLELAFDMDDDSAPQRKRAGSSSLKARTAKRRKQE